MAEETRTNEQERKELTEAGARVSANYEALIQSGANNSGKKTELDASIEKFKDLLRTSYVNTKGLPIAEVSNITTDLCNKMYARATEMFNHAETANTFTGSAANLYKLCSIGRESSSSILGKNNEMRAIFNNGYTEVAPPPINIINNSAEPKTR